MVLCYITNRAIQNRLDETFGPMGWRNKFINDGKTMMCGISVRNDDTGEWVTKWDGVEIEWNNKNNNDRIDPVKTANSNAMKRCAVHWGIGRYLYNLESTFADCFQNKDGKNRGKAKGQRGDIYFTWNPPALPEWALPEDERNQQRQQNNQPQQFNQQPQQQYNNNHQQNHQQQQPQQAGGQYDNTHQFYQSAAPQQQQPQRQHREGDRYPPSTDKWGLGPHRSKGGNNSGHLVAQQQQQQPQRQPQQERTLRHRRSEDGPTAEQQWAWNKENRQPVVDRAAQCPQTQERQALIDEALAEKRGAEYPDRVISPAQYKQITEAMQYADIMPGEFLAKVRLDSLGELTQSRLAPSLKWLRTQAANNQPTAH